MPFSTNTFTYNGGARTFTISLALGYLKESDIKCFVVGELDGNGDQLFRAFTFDSEFVVNLTADLNSGQQITVQRTVDKATLDVDFETGGDVTPRNLMILAKQGMMSVQEILDGRVSTFDPVNAAAAALASQVAAAASAAAAAQSAEDAEVQDLTAYRTAVDQDAIDTADLATAAAASVVLDDVQDTAIALKAPIANPAFTGNPTADTQSPGNNSTRLANTAFVSAAMGVGGAADVQVFTAGGTWTKPAGAKFVLVEMIGAGGSGGRSGNGDGGGGGAGGGYGTRWFDADDLSATESIFVGAGGAGVTASGIGNDGGDSQFADPAKFLCPGGEGGTKNSGAGRDGWDRIGYPANPLWGGKGANGVQGGVGAVGGISLYGGGGGGGGGDITAGGAGGVSQYAGNGGDGTQGTGVPEAGFAPGGGGGGIENATTSGAGAVGKVTVTTI